METFPLHLVAEPTAHLSNDPRDVYNNLLVFIVNEDRQKRSATPTEMHIFQCKLVAVSLLREKFSSEFFYYINFWVEQVKRKLAKLGRASRKEMGEKGKCSQLDDYNKRNGTNRFHWRRTSAAFSNSILFRLAKWPRIFDYT